MQTLAQYSKAIAALLGALTPAAIVGVLALFGIHVDTAVVATAMTIVAGVATLLAPANAPKPVAPPAVPPLAAK